MPKCIKKYADEDKARKYRNHQRKENYKTGRLHQKVRGEWTNKEAEAILNPDASDRVLALQLKRSVQAIQVKRSKLKSMLLCN